MRLTRNQPEEIGGFMVAFFAQRFDDVSPGAGERAVLQELLHCGLGRSAQRETPLLFPAVPQGLTGAPLWVYNAGI